MKLDGIWEPVEVVLVGEEIPADLTASISFSVTGNHFVFTIGAEPNKGTLHYFPYTVPMGIDMMVESGPNKKQTLKGIYKYSGGFLFICLNFFSEERPKKFASTKENKFYNIRFKRAE